MIVECLMEDCILVQMSFTHKTTSIISINGQVLGMILLTGSELCIKYSSPPLM